MQTLKKYSLYFLILIYVSGSIGFILKPSFFAPFTPFTLIFTSFVFIIYHSKSNFLIAFSLIAIIGYIAETIGVATGKIFGDYYYGNSLGKKLLGVPLVIAINWSLMVSSAAVLAQSITKNKLIIAFAAGVITTGTDLLIEQVAGKLDFWHFKNDIAGVQNYIAWFLITFTSVFFLHKYLQFKTYKTSLIILALQLLFFGSIYLFY